MKKCKMILKISSITKIGLILLLLMGFTAFAQNTHYNKSSFVSLAFNVASVQAQQVVSHAQTLQVAGKDAQKETKKQVQNDDARANYDKINDKFKDIGPGNNTVKFVVALVVFLLAFWAVGKMKGKVKWVAVIAVLLALGYISKITYTEARALGRQQGYAPVQPIWFSHKVHAGQNGINCEYCHADARTSRHAGVPSLNVCMNCHSQVKEGKVSGTKEIAKIYKHLGYNPTTMQYDKPGKPIEWVKVHNLPDHVYFNHAQHVQAGKVACQECHGPVEEMDRVVEYKELAMGDFCLKCHRERGIDQSNPYYKHYDFKDMKKGDKITVDKIGGADCSSCHY